MAFLVCVPRSLFKVCLLSRFAPVCWMFIYSTKPCMHNCPLLRWNSHASFFLLFGYAYLSDRVRLFNGMQLYMTYPGGMQWHSLNRLGMHSAVGMPCLIVVLMHAPYCVTCRLFITCMDTCIPAAIKALNVQSLITHLLQVRIPT